MEFDRISLRFCVDKTKLALYSLTSGRGCMLYSCFLKFLLSLSGILFDNRIDALYQAYKHDACGGTLEWLLTFSCSHVTRFPRILLGEVV